MGYRPNPFLQRMAERATSDQEFVKLFSPRMIEQLDDDTFDGAVHIFRSPPGGGKTTLLRAFTPTSLRAFWNSRKAPDMVESYQRLVSLRVIHEQNGPQLLGVLLSCASGYADLPPGATPENQGLLRALFNCRVVLRTLRSLASLLAFSSSKMLADVSLHYGELALDLQDIPRHSSAAKLVEWAELWERRVYGKIDTLGKNEVAEASAHTRLEGVLWLQGIKFKYAERDIAPMRVLLLDDVHKLRRRQRAMLIQELVELRPSIPVWLAERSIALGDQLLSPGARPGRDARQYSLEELSRKKSRSRFSVFAQNILERRLAHQDLLPSGSFAPFLRTNFEPDEGTQQVSEGIATCLQKLSRYVTNSRYSDWMTQAEEQSASPSISSLRQLLVTGILLARDESRRQLTLDLGPLSRKERDALDNSSVQAAAEIFAHEKYRIPYYFGMERLCLLATNNIEELLHLAAGLYEGLLAKQILRKEPLLSPKEQERLIREVAQQRRDFIPKSHTQGARAQRILDAIGRFCRDKTFAVTAPYAPGVTGVRLTDRELERLRSPEKPLSAELGLLRSVLTECIAENLLFTKSSAESGSRDSGTILYLNRTLCAYYGLPLQLGGWQDLATEKLLTWMNNGRTRRRQRRLEVD